MNRLISVWCMSLGRVLLLDPSDFHRRWSLFLFQGGMHGMSTGAVVMAFLRSSNSACWSVFHSNGCPFFVNRRSGSHLLEKFSIYRDRYAIIWMNDTSSSLFLGHPISWMALILLALGCKPLSVKLWPWNSREGLPNSHFSFLRV